MYVRICKHVRMYMCVRCVLLHTYVHMYVRTCIQSCDYVTVSAYVLKVVNVRTYVCTYMCVCGVCVYVQVYDATKRELDSLKKQVKEAEEEGRTTRDKVSDGHSAAKNSRSFYSCLGLKN